MHHTENQPIKMLSSSHLNIAGLNLLGRATFRKTFETLAPHCHKEMEFIAVIKGTQQYVVNNRQYTLRGGNVFMTFPNEVHSNGPFPQEVADIIWFQLDLSSPENFLGLASPYSNFLFEQLSNYRKRITHVSQKELQKLQSAFTLLGSENTQQHLLGWNNFLEFIISNFCKSSDAHTKANTANVKLDMTKAEDYINTHITENPTLESIAEYCGLSATKFSAVFKEKMGVTPHTYIVSRKIDIAKNLLLNSNSTVTDIAFQLNFSSSDYFSSVFKKYTGYTPTQYRSR